MVTADYGKPKINEIFEAPETAIVESLNLDQCQLETVKKMKSTYKHTNIHK